MGICDDSNEPQRSAHGPHCRPAGISTVRCGVRVQRKENRHGSREAYRSCRGVSRGPGSRHGDRIGQPQLRDAHLFGNVRVVPDALDATRAKLEPIFARLATREGD